VQAVAHQQWVFLLLVNVTLLALGIFIEPLPALLLTAPLFLPLANAFGVDLVHLGVVMTANLAIALYTPPVGGTLFVAAKLADAGIGEITRQLVPLLAAAVAVLLLITYVPSLSLAFGRWLL
jgi:C4-dicarboxylate transporter DctM subunit